MKCLGRILFISLISCSAIVFYSCGDPPSNKENADKDSLTTIFNVEGLHCSSCENALAGALQDKNKYPLIRSVEASSANKTCKVVHDKKMSIKEVEDAINATKIKVKSIVK